MSGTARGNSTFPLQALLSDRYYPDGQPGGKAQPGRGRAGAYDQRRARFWGKVLPMKVVGKVRDSKGAAMRRTALLLVLVALIGLPAVIPTASAEGANKVTICHKPETPAEQTISVASAALQAHLAHGDYLGDCGNGPDDAGDPDDSTVPVDACTAINSGSLENLLFQGTEVVHVQLLFARVHTVYPTVCNADGQCALLFGWANPAGYEDFNFPWRAGDLWKAGPITIGLTLSADPLTQTITCSHT